MEKQIFKFSYEKVNFKGVTVIGDLRLHESVYSAIRYQNK
jgi:hypothetical protein